MTISLPPWASSIRPHQQQALASILAEFASGTQVVMLDAPTGSGKTLIGELVRQSLDARALYLCSSISLQSQFHRDFPNAVILKGRSNYTTYDDPSTFPKLNAGDCTKLRTTFPACFSCLPDENEEGLHCRWCHPVESCPYEQAKFAAIRSPLVCTNTAYFLHEANYVGNLPLNRQLVIVDEADTLEDVVMSFVEVSVTAKKAREYRIEPPSRKTVESSWIEWALSTEDTLRSFRIPGDGIDAIRARQSLSRLLGNVKRLNDPERGLASGGWVYTGYDKGDIAFKPVTIDALTFDYLFRHCARWLLMSATTISFDVFAETLGIVA
jgi:Rad3-related DNA helicase